MACSKLTKSSILLGSCLDTLPRHVLYKGGALRFEHVVCTFPKQKSIFSALHHSMSCMAKRSGRGGFWCFNLHAFCNIVSR